MRKRLVIAAALVAVSVTSLTAYGQEKGDDPAPTQEEVIAQIYKTPLSNEENKCVDDLLGAIDDKDMLAAYDGGIRNIGTLMALRSAAKIQPASCMALHGASVPEEASYNWAERVFWSVWRCMGRFGCQHRSGQYCWVHVQTFCHLNWWWY
jgi:hypothetical protein